MSDKKQEKKQDKKKFSEFAPEIRNVTIRGKEYKVREMSLAEKIKTLGPVAESIAKNVDFKAANEGMDEFEANIKMFLCIGEVLPEILSMCVPDFKDWDDLSESETREPLRTVIEVNDFVGFIRNFTDILGRAMSLQRL